MTTQQMFTLTYFGLLYLRYVKLTKKEIGLLQIKGANINKRCSIKYQYTIHQISKVFNFFIIFLVFSILLFLFIFAFKLFSK